MIKKSYVAGVLDTLGCFVLQKRNHTCYFKLGVNHNEKTKLVVLEQLFLFLQDKYRVTVKRFANKECITFVIYNKKSLARLIKFIDQNCYIKNYKNFNEVKDYLLTRTCSIKAATATLVNSSDCVVKPLFLLPEQEQTTDLPLKDDVGACGTKEEGKENGRIEWYCWTANRHNPERRKHWTWYYGLVLQMPEKDHDAQSSACPDKSTDLLQ